MFFKILNNIKLIIIKIISINSNDTILTNDKFLISTKLEILYPT